MFLMKPSEMEISYSVEVMMKKVPKFAKISELAKISIASFDGAVLILFNIVSTFHVSILKTFRDISNKELRAGSARY